MKDQQCTKHNAIQIFNGFLEDYHSCSYRELMYGDSKNKN
jgi:hypothetical protein